MNRSDISQSNRHVSERDAINVRGVIAIRWVAALGQFFTIMVVHLFLGVRLPLVALLTILAGTAAVNLGLVILYRVKPPIQTGRGQIQWHHVLGSIMLFDLLALTMLLYFTGGMANPFSLFYFVNLVFSAMLLPQGWVWALNAVAIAGVGFLFVAFQTIPILEEHHPGDELNSTSFHAADAGSLVAYATCATVIVFFTSHISGQLRLHEHRFRELADLQARSERVQALGTLAAGAAHELGSPLSTIAVISGEVQRELDSGDVTEHTLQGMQAIRSELARCRQILDRMSTDAGLAVGESITDTTVGNLVRTSIEGLDPDSHIQLSFADAAEDVELRAPLHGLAQAIRGILKNAIDASHGTRPAECHVSVSHNECVLSVQDHGAGMDAEMLRRVGEPFFTTKQTGMGTGLGVFLARNAIEGLGGNLEISSSPGTGTRVVIQLPLSPSRERPWDKYPLTGRLF